MTALYVLLIILSLLAAAAVIPVRVIVRLNADEREMTLRYAFFRISLYPPPERKKTETEKPREEKKTEKRRPNVKMMLSFANGARSDFTALLTRTVGYLVKHGIRIRELRISGSFGTDDPADTGIICGAVYTVVYNTISFIKRHCRLGKWEVNISPDFNEACFEAGMYAELVTCGAHFLAMFAIVLFHAAKIGIKFLKFRKEYGNG